MSRRRRVSVPASPHHLRRTETWNGLHFGDPVEIEGAGRRGASWTFRAFVRNERNGAESVEVFGGRPGEQAVRSFRPGQVFPVGALRKGRPSLEVEPQLPFG